jgi:hypothetical protein
VNKKLVRRLPLVAVACAVALLLCNFARETRVAAGPDSLEEGMERLAKKAIALPHERRMSLLWTNYSLLSEQRMEGLRTAFAAQLEAAQVRLTQGETAPPLCVAIQQTPTQIVFTATVPGEGSTRVVIEEVPRATVGIDVSSGSSVRLKKELVWQQEARILGAVMLVSSASGEKRLAVLTEETLQIYRGGLGNWRQEHSKALPGPRQAQRSARAQLMVAEDASGRVAILVPGKRCEASVADDSAVACENVPTEWPSGRLMSMPSCGAETWWLTSDGADWTAEDRLLLSGVGAGKDAVTVAELSVGGPVISISAADSAASATAVVKDLDSGNYEVYRVALACGD